MIFWTRFTKQMTLNIILLQDIPLVKQSENTRGPGLAKAIESPTEEQTDVQVHHLSEEEAKQLDKDCTERFIKVNVKHITDGQV